MNAIVGEPLFLRKPLPTTAENDEQIFGIRNRYIESFQGFTGDASQDAAALAHLRSQISELWRPVLGSGDRAYYQDGRSSLAEYHKANNIFAGHDIFSPIARKFGEAEGKLRIFANTGTRVPSRFYSELVETMNELISQCQQFRGMRNLSDYFTNFQKYLTDHPELSRDATRDIGKESNRLYEYHNMAALATQNMLEHMQRYAKEIGASVAMESKGAG